MEQTVLIKGGTVVTMDAAERVVAADVLVAVVVAALAAEAIVNDHATTLPVMLVLSLLGFAGAVSIARFVAERDLAVRWRDSQRPEKGEQ